MQFFRASLILFLFVVLTLPSMALQAVLLFFGSAYSRTFPVWYHKKVGRLLGVRLHARGGIQDNGRPVLVIANHASWLDIIILSCLAPVSFVAKHEIASWPFFSMMARLQRTIFVNRQRKREAHGVANEIMNRLASGDNVIFFPEGTANDGNMVLPFKSPLFASVKPTAKQKREMEARDAGFDEHNVLVQTVSIAYTRLGGLPLGRQRRHKVAWVGDTTLLPHIWSLLKTGTIDVFVEIGEPVLLDSFENRKELCRHTEADIRKAVSQLLMYEFSAPG